MDLHIAERLEVKSFRRANALRIVAAILAYVDVVWQSAAG
jgi:hypothetical protein